MKTTHQLIAAAAVMAVSVSFAAEIPQPSWKHLSSKTGELPVPNGGTQQTACVTADFDGDGVADIVIAERTQAPAIIWLRHTAKGWEKFIIDDTFQTPEAGGLAYDADGDGDLDLIIGGDWRSDELWWYENPKPNFDAKTPWKRHLIQKGSGKARHDQAIADFKGTGKPQLMFWSQGARKLFMAEIPADPRTAESWPVTEILDTSKVKAAIKQEGMAAFDVDGDGKTDFLAGLYWFKHEGGNKFRPIQIADHPGRIAAGHFKPGKVAQIVMAPGDGDGPLLFIECKGNPTDPKSWTRRDLLGKPVIHGHSLAVADINGDGHLDILCGEMAKWGHKPEPDNPDAKAWILYGDGQGNFEVTVLATGFGFHEARVADVNGDGRPDIISKPYNWDTPRLDIWLNLGSSTPRAARGPLRVHPQNSRYFTDGSAKAVYLTGAHTWDNLQDMGEADPPTAFDFGAYLDFLAKHGHNFIRLWRWELVSWDTAANDKKTAKRLVTVPHPWARTGPGQALDGKPRFNLDRFDDVYFQRLRSRVAAAHGQGIYVSVMMFEGWGVQHVSDAWKAYPFHPENNVNGLDGDADGDGRGLEVHTLRVPAVTKVQEAYVRKVIDTVNDLDNVLYEISNEAGAYSTEWQEHFIRFIHDYEKGKPKQHPVGMTFQYSRDPKQRGSNTNLFCSTADWISPNPQWGQFSFRTNPPSADGRKVILADTDHLWGIGGDVAWVWKSFLRGLNPLFMDPYKQNVLQQGADAKWEPVRRAMGVTRRLAERVDLAAMTPRGDLASSGYCLANPAKEYLVYLPAGGEVSVELSGAAGEFRVEWIHPVEGRATPAASVSGGASRTLKAPFEGHAVLYLSGRP